MSQALRLTLVARDGDRNGNKLTENSGFSANEKDISFIGQYTWNLKFSYGYFQIFLFTLKTEPNRFFQIRNTSMHIFRPTFLDGWSFFIQTWTKGNRRETRWEQKKLQADDNERIRASFNLFVLEIVALELNPGKDRQKRDGKEW